ncbi:hypothetical protein UQ22_18670 [Escherichia coli]|nr:hypothetical protein UQ22_18670 [Escherichia coli]
MRGIGDVYKGQCIFQRLLNKSFCRIFIGGANNWKAFVACGFDDRFYVVITFSDTSQHFLLQGRNRTFWHFVDFGCGVSVGHIWDIKRPQINSKIEIRDF